MATTEPARTPVTLRRLEDHLWQAVSHQEPEPDDRPSTSSYEVVVTASA